MKGTIIGFEGTHSSNTATLMIRNEDDKVEAVFCDNAPTVRALHAIFGDVIAEGHIVDVKKLVGRQIKYETDDIGVLSYIEGEEE